MTDAYDTVVSLLETGEKNYHAIKTAVRALFAPNACAPYTAVAYAVLYALQNEGRIKMENKRVSGAFEHLDAPMTFIKLI